MRKRLRVDRRAGLLLGGILFASFVALGGSVALPAGDPDLVAEEVELSALEAEGMRVYRNEGCWYCHTRFVRQTPIDDRLGDPTGPAHYAGEAPAMIGHERIGPDLAHLGTRFADASSLVSYLRDPGGEGARTSMPSFAYLGEDDLRALAAYLLASR